MPLSMLLAAVFGAVMTVSFAPANAWWLTPFCMAGLFMLGPGRGARQAAWLGLAFGLGWFGSGVWWLAAGLAAHTDAGWALALLLTGALAGWLALFPALAVGCLALWPAPGPWRWAAGAAWWTLAEWTRASLFGGFPWLLTGAAHASGPLGALAPWAGVQGVGWANAFLALMLADCLPRARWRPMAAVLAATALACVLLPLGHWTAPTGQRLALRLIQGNIPQFQQITPAGLAEAARIYTTLAGAGTADLTLLPESAFPVAWDALPAPVVQRWRGIARTRNTALAIGTFGTRGAKLVGNNSVMAVLPDGSGYRYDKVHLVPFGEQTWPWTAWLTDRMYRQFGALSAGAPGQAPLALPKGRVAFGLCFESLFDTATAAKARDAGLLVNLTNFGWFDGTYAAAQHLQAGQMRARETGRWFVQVSNSGGSAIVGPDGAIVAALPVETLGVLDGVVEMVRGTTPFMRCGNAPLLLACLALLAIQASRSPRRHWTASATCGASTDVEPARSAIVRATRNTR